MFGLENIGKETVQEATTKLDPLLRDVEYRLATIFHGLLDRFEIDIKIKLNPDPTRNPKATPAE